MQQIADWLENLGMSEYVQCFVENRIDFSVLPDLTDQHLKDLGLPLGDRLKILRAIRELSKTGSEPPQPEPRSQDTAERRQVTVMFSDLVGSRHSRPGWIPKTSARSSQPIKSASPTPCSVSAASWRSTWATGCWCTSGTRKLTRMMPSEQSGPAGVDRRSAD